MVNNQLQKSLTPWSRVLEKLTVTLTFYETWKFITACSWSFRTGRIQCHPSALYLYAKSEYLDQSFSYIQYIFCFPHKNYNERFDVLTVALLEIQFFWNVMLYWLAKNFKRAQCHHLHGLDSLTLNIKAIYPLAAFVTIHQSRLRNIPESCAFKNHVSYIENVAGRKAVLEMNMPALNTRNAKARRPTWTPNSRQILLEYKENRLQLQLHIRCKQHDRWHENSANKNYRSTIWNSP